VAGRVYCRDRFHYSTECSITAHPVEEAATEQILRPEIAAVKSNIPGQREQMAAA